MTKTKLYKITCASNRFYVEAENEQQAKELFEQELANGTYRQFYGHIDATDVNVEEC